LDRVLAESSYGQNEKSEIERVFAGAAESGIGAGLLLPRVQEAKAKRVSARRLVEALLLEIERLATARDILLGAGASAAFLFDDAGWQRTANLVAWGASEDEIRLLAASCAGDVRKYLEASYLFTSLVEWGLDRETSGRLVSAVAVSKIDAGEYPGVFEILIDGRRLKLLPSDVAEQIILAADESENVRQLHRKVLNVR